MEYLSVGHQDSALKKRVKANYEEVLRRPAVTALAHAQELGRNKAMERARSSS